MYFCKKSLMYKSVIRPFLFLFKPEAVHHLVVNFLKVTHRIPFIKALLRVFFISKNNQLKRKVFGLEFQNPVGMAAGFDKNAEVFDTLESFGFGFAEIGTLTPLAQDGNPKPRLFRLVKDKALINRMGFNNKGVHEAVANLKKRKSKIIIGGNIGKNTLTPNDKADEDYLKCFAELFPYVDYFTVNVSCPNICNLHELQDKDALLQLLSGIQKQNKQYKKSKPVLLKISPDLNNAQINDTLEIIKQTELDGIVVANTTSQRYGLSLSEEEIQKIGNGGLSGKPLNKRSTEIIKYIAEKTSGDLPIIASGGIMKPEDALEKLKAGASLVQVYTGFIYEGPAFVKRINKQIVKSNT